jgi:hypothetical protein
MKQRQANPAHGKDHGRTPATPRREKSAAGPIEALNEERRDALRDADLLDLQRAAGNAAVSAALERGVSDQHGVYPTAQREAATAVAPQTKKAAGPKAGGSGVERLLGTLIPDLLPRIMPDQLDALQRRFEIRASNAAVQKRHKALLKERDEGGWYFETRQGTAQVSDKAEAWQRKVNQLLAKLKPEPEGPDQFTVPILMVLDPGILSNVPTGDEEAERTFRVSMWQDLIRFPMVTGTLTERSMSALERSKAGEDAAWTTPDVILESGRRNFPHTGGIITFNDLTTEHGGPFARRYKDEVTERPEVVKLRNAVFDLEEAVDNGKMAHEALTEAGKAHPWVKSISEWLGGPGVGDYIALVRDVKKHPEKGTLEEREGELEAPEPPITIWTAPKEQTASVLSLIKTRQIKLAVIRLMVAQKMVQVVLERFEGYQHRVMKGAGTAVTALEVAKAAGKAAEAYLTGGGWLKLGVTAKAAAAGAYSFAQGTAGNVGAYFFAPTEAKNWGAIGKQAGIDAAVELLGGTLEGKFKATLETKLEHQLKAYPAAIKERVLEAASKATAAVYKAPAEAVLKHFVAGEKLPGSIEELADKIAEESLKEGAFGLFLSEGQQVPGKGAEVLVKSKKEGEAKHGE